MISSWRKTEIPVSWLIAIGPDAAEAASAVLNAIEQGWLEPDLAKVCLWMRAGTEAARDYFAKNLTHENSGVRAGALSGLGALGPTATSLTSAVVERLEDGERHVRMEAAEALGHMGEPALAVPALIEVLERDHDMHWSAVTALAALGESERIVPLFLEGLVFPDHAERLDASAATPFFLEALSHPSKDVRSQSAECLGVLGGRARYQKAPRAARILEGLARDDAAPRVRAEILTAMVRTAPESEDVAARLLAALGDESPTVRQRAASDIKDLPVSDKIVSSVTAALEDPDASVRATAAATLGDLGQAAASAIEALVELTDDPDRAARVQAVRALGRIGELARDAAPVLWRIAHESDDEPAEDAWFALEFLHAIGPSRTARKAMFFLFAVTGVSAAWLMRRLWFHRIGGRRTRWMMATSAALAMTLGWELLEARTKYPYERPSFLERIDTIPLATNDLVLAIGNPRGHEDAFGYALAATKDGLVVGTLDDGAYIFEPSGELRSRLERPDSDGDDFFGSQVAATGTTVLIAAPQDDRIVRDAGAVFLFDGATGKLRTRIDNPTPLVRELLEGPEVSGSTEQPTRQKPLTNAGALLGTVQYMAPEQLEGEDVDARIDIFAFGAVLYEMITGRKAFEGESQASVIGAILKGEPAPLELEPTRPRGLERIIRKCLAKDPEDRWYAAHDLMDALRWIDEDKIESSEPTTAQSKRPFSLVLGFAAAALVAFLAFVLLRTASRESIATSRYEITLPANTVITDYYGRAPLAFSPDGRRLVYAATDDLGVQHLYLRENDQFESSVVPGTENAHTPFFSPDGGSVGFFASGKLWKIALTGAAPREICDVPTATFGRGASWGSDDSILFTSGAGSGLYRVSSRGGSIETLIAAGAVASPQLLDGESVLFTVSDAYGTGRYLKALFADTGEIRHMDELGKIEWARYLPTGHLVYLQSDSLMAMTFDPRGFVPTGRPVTLEHGAKFGVSVSNNGAMAYVSGASGDHGSVAVLDRSGRELRSLSDPTFFYSRFSPTGRQISAVDDDGGDVIIIDLDRGSTTRATFQGTADHAWAPDGKADGRFIAYVLDESGRDEVYVQPYPASGEKWIVSTAGGAEPGWTRGGRELIYRNGSEVLSVSVTQEPKIELSAPQILFQGRYLVSRAPSGSVSFDVSPDGDRFVMIRPDPSSELKKIQVVLNWFDELERLVP
ncbi:MAG: hypothetical protein BMS9Abin37_2458 [Acidobacteriota bacterium]|nr:MAG: hypothetical protein BMS9Abin37_2458 [Acidobacteriota bacterium]